MSFWAAPHIVKSVKHHIFFCLHLVHHSFFSCVLPQQELSAENAALVDLTNRNLSHMHAHMCACVHAYLLIMEVDTGMALAH